MNDKAVGRNGTSFVLHNSLFLLKQDGTTWGWMKREGHGSLFKGERKGETMKKRETRDKKASRLSHRCNFSRFLRLVSADCRSYTTLLSLSKLSFQAVLVQITTIKTCPSSSVVQQSFFKRKLLSWPLTLCFNGPTQRLIQLSSDPAIKHLNEHEQWFDRILLILMVPANEANYNSCTVVLRHNRWRLLSHLIIIIIPCWWTSLIIHFLLIWLPTLLWKYSIYIYIYTYAHTQGRCTWHISWVKLHIHI